MQVPCSSRDSPSDRPRTPDAAGARNKRRVSCPGSILIRVSKIFRELQKFAKSGVHTIKKTGTGVSIIGSERICREASDRAGRYVRNNLRPESSR